MHNSCYDVLLWCYSKVSKVHETVAGQRSCVFIIYSRRIHKRAHRVLYDLFKLICIWIIFSKISTSLDKLKDIDIIEQILNMSDQSLLSIFMYTCLKKYLLVLFLSLIALEKHYLLLLIVRKFILLFIYFFKFVEIFNM